VATVPIGYRLDNPSAGLVADWTWGDAYAGPRQRRSICGHAV